MNGDYYRVHFWNVSKNFNDNLDLIPTSTNIVYLIFRSEKSVSSYRIKDKILFGRIFVLPSSFFAVL